MKANIIQRELPVLKGVGLRVTQSSRTGTEYHCRTSFGYLRNDLLQNNEVSLRLCAGHASAIYAAKSRSIFHKLIHGMCFCLDGLLSRNSQMRCSQKSKENTKSSNNATTDEVGVDAGGSTSEGNGAASAAALIIDTSPSPSWFDGWLAEWRDGDR